MLAGILHDQPSNTALKTAGSTLVIGAGLVLSLAIPVGCIAGGIWLYHKISDKKGKRLSDAVDGIGFVKHSKRMYDDFKRYYRLVFNSKSRKIELIVV